MGIGNDGDYAILTVCCFMMSGGIMKKALLLLLTVVLAVSCNSTVSPSLVVIEDETLEAVIKKEKKEFDDGISVTVEGIDIDREEIAGVFISIENNSGKKYEFNESDIVIFGGDCTSGEWTEIGEWNSGEYLTYAEERHAEDQLWFRKTLDSLTGSASDDKALTSTKTLTATRSYLESNSAEKISSSFITDPVWLADVILYSKEIGNESTYSGLVLFNSQNENKKTYLDIKIVYTHGDESREFMLIRSDKKNILNPWLDSPYAKMTVAAVYGITAKNYGIKTIHTNPKWSQLYHGVAFSQNYIGFQIGLTRKVFPYTWLLCGLDFVLNSQYGSDIAPQVGAAFVVNNITLFTLGEYGLNSRKMGVEVGAGYAFTIR